MRIVKMDLNNMMENWWKNVVKKLIRRRDKMR